MTAAAASRRLSQSALLGLVVWAGLLLVPLADGVGGPLALGAHLVLLAPLVLVPLLLDVAAVPRGAGVAVSASLAWAVRLVGPGALGVAASFLVRDPRWAGALAAPWLTATGAVAVWGLVQALRQRAAGRLGAPEVAVAAGCGMLPGGAVWLLLSRMGVDPGPYGPVVVVLTAAHFHYGAFVAPVWAGLLGRALDAERPGWRRVYAGLVAGLIVGFWLVAAGIALSRGPAGDAVVETVGVVLLSVSAMGLGGMGLAAAPRLADRWGALMVAVSGGSLALAMGLALWFHFGAALATPVDVAWMLPRHGWLQAVGFGLWGALGWRRLRDGPAPGGRGAEGASPP